MERTTAQVAMEELTMALMYLSRFCEGSKFSESTDFIAWKGYDFDVINNLEDDDYIRQSSHPSRTKRVYLTETGIVYAKEILDKYGIADRK